MAEDTFSSFDPTEDVRIPPKEAASKWADFMSSDANRAALMQFGISLMQPIGLGQDALGHLGQAIGRGAEASQRSQAIDAGARDVERTAGQKDRALDIAEIRATKPRVGVKGLSPTALFRAGKQDEAARMRFFARQAELTAKQANTVDFLAAPGTPPHPYKGKTAAEIMVDPAFQAQARKAWEAASGKTPQAPDVGEEDVTEEAPVDVPVAAATPPVTPAPPAAGPLEAARAAIAKGAPRDAVIRRLQARGIDVTGL